MQVADGALPAQIETLTKDEVQARWEARKLRGIYRVSDEDYHGGAGLSSTGVKRILRSPAHFLEAIANPVDSEALRRGRMVHEAVLQPEVYAARYALEPALEGPKTKNPWKQEWDAFKEMVAREGLQIISHEDNLMCHGILEALRASPMFQGMMAERPLLEIAAYTQENIGDKALLTKAKADILLPGVIADLKTCEDARPEAFARHIIDYGYHTSAAYYCDIFSAALGQKFDTFVWICVEKKKPHGVRFYPASQEMLRIGRLEYQRALATYAECLASGIWPAYPEQFEELELPTWYTRRFA